MFLAKHGHLIVQLIYKDNQFYLEGIPVNIVNDQINLGIRLIELNSIKSNRKYFFKVRLLNKYTDIKKPIKGIILKRGAV